MINGEGAEKSNAYMQYYGTTCDVGCDGRVSAGECDEINGNAMTLYYHLNASAIWVVVYPQSSVRPSVGTHPCSVMSLEVDTA